MGLITAGLALQCSDRNRRGGIKNIYLANRDEVTSFTTASGSYAYSAATMASGKVFYEVEFDKYRPELTITPSKENGSAINEINLNIILPKNTADHNEFINSLLESCGLIAIVTDFNGQNFVLGYDETQGTDAYLEATEGESGFGAALNDANEQSIVLTGTHAEVPRTFTGDVSTLT